MRREVRMRDVTNKQTNKVSNHIVDPAFRLMRFPLDGELDFYLKN